MKIQKTASGSQKITISKAEWLHIGKHAGWMNQSKEIFRTTIGMFLTESNVQNDVNVIVHYYPEGTFEGPHQTGIQINITDVELAQDTKMLIYPKEGTETEMITYPAGTKFYNNNTLLEACNCVSNEELEEKLYDETFEHEFGIPPSEVKYTPIPSNRNLD